MSIALPWYEVSVKVRHRGSRYVIKKHHIEAKNHDVARQKAKRYGEPLSAYKLDFSTAGIEHLTLKQQPAQPSVSPAIAMDEMIWARRNKRRDNAYKDKTP